MGLGPVHGDIGLVADPLSMLYIEHNLLFIHMRKTGGTSLSKALGEGDNRVVSSIFRTLVEVVEG
jgi:hypothetical protein